MKEYTIQGGKGKSIQDFDSQRPKKCLSAYMIFVRETRPKIVQEKEAALAENESKLTIFQLKSDSNHFYP